MGEAVYSYVSPQSYGVEGKDIHQCRVQKKHTRG